MMKKIKTQRIVYTVPEVKVLLLLHNDVLCASNVADCYVRDNEEDVEF